MNENMIHAILGEKLSKIIMNKVTAYQKEEGWEYIMTDPILEVESQGDSEESLYWALTWDETEEGDNRLTMKATQDKNILYCFDLFEGFKEPLIVSSSVQLEQSTVHGVSILGYRDAEKEFSTSLLLKLETVYVTLYSGPVFKVIVTNTLPKDLDRVLYSVGESE